MRQNRIEFESSLFRSNVEDMVALRKKYIDPCTFCKGRSVKNTVKGPVKCPHCREPYLKFAKYVAADIPKMFREMSSDDITTNFQNDNKASLLKVTSYCDKLPDALDSGFSLFLTGTAGKSFMASIILKKILDSGYSGYFILFQELGRRLLKSLSDVQLADDLNILARDIDFLVIDEIDQVTMKNNSSAFIDLLRTFFKVRYYCKKPIIVTATRDKVDVINAIGDAISGLFTERVSSLGFIGNSHAAILQNLETKIFGTATEL